MARNLEGDQAYKHNLVVRERLIEDGAYPYPQEGHKTHTNAEALEQRHGSEVTVAGRITAMRGHGGMRFVDIQDESGDLQVVIKKNEVEKIERMDNISAGDYLRVTGGRMVTRSGEESVLAAEFDLLVKSICEEMGPVKPVSVELSNSTASLDEMIKEAKDGIRSALIGLLVVFGGYVLVNFIIERLISAVGAIG